MPVYCFYIQATVPFFFTTGPTVRMQHKFWVAIIPTHTPTAFKAYLAVISTECWLFESHSKNFSGRLVEQKRGHWHNSCLKLKVWREVEPVFWSKVAIMGISNNTLAKSRTKCNVCFLRNVWPWVVGIRKEAEKQLNEPFLGSQSFYSNRNIFSNVL